MLALGSAAHAATVLNGGFESGLTSWTTFGTPLSTQGFAAQSSTLGVWFPSYDSANASGLYQDFASFAGEPLYFGANLNRETNAVLSTLEMKLEYFDATNVLLGSSVVNLTSAFNAASAGSWSTYSVSGLAPTNTAYGRAVLYYDADVPLNGNFGANASFFGDNFVVTPEPSRAMLLMFGVMGMVVRRRRD